MKRRVSICGKFVAKFASHLTDNDITVTNIETGEVYKNSLCYDDKTKKHYYKTVNTICGYSQNCGIDNEYSSTLCQIRLMDANLANVQFSIFDKNDQAVKLSNYQEICFRSKKGY